MAKRPVPKYDFKAFGAAIKAARTGRKESRKKVSDEMFISPRYLANIENKGQHPSLQIFFELMLRYNISVAFHLIQSFEPGEVDYQKAHEIGKQLADAVTKGQHEYVLTTHIDKGHVHNHIIFCAVNFVDHRKYKVDCHKRLEHPLEEHGSVNVVHIVLFRYHADKLIA